MDQAPDDWTDTERGLWEAFRRGEVYDLRAGRVDGPADLVLPAPAGAAVRPDRESHGPDDPFTAEEWGPGRTVRAEVVARLLLHGPEPVPGRVASLKLTGARITGDLTLAGGRIDCYVEFQLCRFDRKLLISEAAAGTLRLVSCALPRLEASRLATEGDVHLARCGIPGGIRLTDARIGTDLLLNQAAIGPDAHGRAVSADGIAINQDCEAERLELLGELSLRSARIGGRLSLRGAALRSAPDNPNAFNAPRITIGHTLYLSGSDDSTWTGSRTVYGSGYGESGDHLEYRATRHTPFRAWGRVRLSDARFDNACLITAAEFHLGPGQELSLNRIQTPELRFTCETPPTGTVSLNRARIGNLVDSPGAWPTDRHISLTGFSYESLRPAEPFPLDRRIAWVESGAEFRPEAYEQLAAALRRDGADEDARTVLLAKQRRRRATLPLPGRLWGHLQDAAVGYGYRPGRAATWLVLAWALGTAYFQEHPPAPIKPDEQVVWNSALYAAGKVLPLIDLGQAGWNPDRPGQWVATALVLTGWVLATTAVAGVTRLLQRG
ncbi:oxidoreductase [Kitasatospora sp. CB02891]|uniref:oxidoreductase n=1 Tax=Kitasatospora sp. CB02891 TaxID=2020329 RepID=UPI0018E21D2E|nr:oxidoreductase [Kitasatospora sp. CB02891]